MKYVLAYQLEGTNTLESYPIPKGFETQMDDLITRSKEVKFKNGLKLKRDEIKGIFSEADYERFYEAFFSPEVKAGPGYKSFLEMGKAMKKKESLDRWRKKNGAREIETTKINAISPQEPLQYVD